MTISLERLLKHMAWANQKTIEHLMTLPPEALQAFATNPEWKVAEIIRHIVASGNFFKVDNALVSVKLNGVPSGFVIVKVAK